MFGTLRNANEEVDHSTEKHVNEADTARRDYILSPTPSTTPRTEPPASESQGFLITSTPVFGYWDKPHTHTHRQRILAWVFVHSR